jgi:hypothetical protein
MALTGSHRNPLRLNSLLNLYDLLDFQDNRFSQAWEKGAR